MATRNFFYDSVDEDRQYGSDTLAQFARGILREGYVPEVGDELVVTESSPPAMSVRVNLGVAWVDGRYFEVFSAPETLTIPEADGGNPRIDRIVVRNDFIERETVLAVKQGSPATLPEPPSLQRDSTIYEISLAQVFVATAETSIEDDDITDERDDPDVCGQTSVHGEKVVVYSLDLIDSSTTWEKPANIGAAVVVCFGGGGGGGGSSQGNGGGGGGGGGAISKATLAADDLPATVSVTIGAGGNGGAPDNDGGNGGNTTFGLLVGARGGNGGQHGNTSNRLGGRANGGLGEAGGDGADGRSTDASGHAALNTTSHAGGGGGGGAYWLSSGHKEGGAGGSNLFASGGAATTGTLNDADDGDLFYGGGGGGGGGATTSTSRTGGQGGTPAGGGGGGGQSDNNTPASGGNGAPGRVIVMTIGMGT